MKHRHYSIIAALFVLTPLSLHAAMISTIDGTLKFGMSGESVRLLQVVLNKSPETQIADTGAGSPGYETGYFGSATRAALKRYQELHAAEVLTPAGLTAGTGVVGVRTRELLNRELSGTSNVTAPRSTSGNTDAEYKALQDRIAAMSKTFNAKFEEAAAGAKAKTDAASAAIVTAQKALAKIDAATRRLENLSKIINADGTINQSAVDKFVSVNLVLPSEPLPGDQVRIFGTGFAPSNTIHLGNTTFTATGTTTGGVLLSATIPTSVTAGTYDLYIENAQGKSESIPLTIAGVVADTAAGTLKPQITSVQPSAGSLSGRITLYGKNFANQNTIITSAGIATGVVSFDGRTISFSLSAVDKTGAAAVDIARGAVLHMLVRNDGGISNVVDYTIQ